MTSNTIDNVISLENKHTERESDVEHSPMQWLTQPGQLYQVEAAKAPFYDYCDRSGNAIEVYYLACIDVYSRKILATSVQKVFNSIHVEELLCQAMSDHGDTPEALIVGRCPEFPSSYFDEDIYAFLEQHGMMLLSQLPGNAKPFKASDAIAAVLRDMNQN